MTWDTLYPKTTMPDFEQIGVYIQNPLWNQMHACLTETYKALPKIEYSGCSAKGWNIKYRKKVKIYVQFILRKAVLKFWS